MPVTDPRELYGLPLDRFVPERGALTKALRGAGEKDEAARVAALRKPSVAAWTVNQLIRTQHRAITALFDSGDELQRAQADVLGGRGDAGTLREAAQHERRAVGELAKVARGLLSSEGYEPTQATLDRVSETLHAAALDEHARGQVREACLHRELRQVGFGAGGAEGGRASRGPTDQAERERTARERTARLKSARADEAAARRLAERAARHMQAALERRDRAAGALRDAEDALATARESAGEAELAHRRAERTLADL